MNNIRESIRVQLFATLANSGFPQESLFFDPRQVKDTQNRAPSLIVVDTNTGDSLALIEIMTHDDLPLLKGMVYALVAYKPIQPAPQCARYIVVANARERTFRWFKTQGEGISASLVKCGQPDYLALLGREPSPQRKTAG